MGGGLTNPIISSPEPSVELAFPLPPSSAASSLKLSGNAADDDGTMDGEDASKFGLFKEPNRNLQSSPVLDGRQKKRSKAYREVLQSYDQLQSRSKSLKEGKSRVLSYVPGGWIEKVGGMTISDYDVPVTTTLLLIGPRGSGKSSLVNKISNVFEDDQFAPERAQISYNPSVGDGTFFQQEYMIPRGSTSFCLHDTRSLSDDTSENIEMLKKWMKKGVRHGELVIRPSDSSSLRAKMKCKGHETGSLHKVTRMVNFVTFVIDGLEVLQSMEINEDEGTSYTRAIAETFNSPYLSFKDDKPAVVVTHGDLLSLAERTRIRVYLGELLGISPVKQIFDIPESNDSSTELTVVDFLRYSLEHADKNLPHKHQLAEKIREGCLSTRSTLFRICMAAFITYWLGYVHAVCTHRSASHIDWATTRHLWLD